MNRKLQIRNSTAEFLTFASQNEASSIEVRFEDETLWLTQQLIAELFQTSIPNISMHIKSIYEDKELEAGATLKNFLTVRQEGTRQVNRNLEYYNLDMIIAVGYRVNSKRAEALCPVSRVSGGEIESAVLLHIKKMLCTPTIVNQLARDLNTPGKEVAEVLNKLTPLWDEMFPAERNRLMHLLLKKVTLYENHLDLDIRTAGVEQILEELDYEDHD